MASEPQVGEDEGIDRLREVISGLHYRNVIDVDHLLNYTSENDIVIESPTNEEIIQGVMNTPTDDHDLDDISVLPSVSSKEEFSGGAYRVKQHIARIPGNFSKRWKSTKEDRVRCKKKTIEDTRTKKKNKNKEDHEIRLEVDLVGTGEEEEVEGLGLRKRPHFLDSMDKFASKVDHEASMSVSKSLRQQHIRDVLFKENTLCASICGYNHSFTAMMEAVGLFGLRYKQPSRYQFEWTVVEGRV
ncbi:hypothetical protein Dsin_000532 [Dipteronia sinensis]|uniref:Uncharacterized protein n=1 Tax=Dipteronia sinensis TaxID=43782 RepID=A0AAE0EHL7_9ROSI|nr:hypothetical protein Dsin_000532 [Dipteronia sinensis]